MEPKDNPEERIRELERPLADTAHASELGSEISRTRRRAVMHTRHRRHPGRCHRR